MHNPVYHKIHKHYGTLPFLTGIFLFVQLISLTEFVTIMGRIMTQENGGPLGKPTNAHFWNLDPEYSEENIVNRRRE
jgi:hypothetical protein